MLLEIKLVLAALLMAFTFYGYHWIGENAVEDYKADQAEVQAQRTKEQQEKYDQVVADNEVLKAMRAGKERVIWKTVTKVVDRPVYKTECVDDEGVELMNKALKGE